jgi:hypothetical protein
MAREIISISSTGGNNPPFPGGQRRVGGQRFTAGDQHGFGDALRFGRQDP